MLITHDLIHMHVDSSDKESVIRQLAQSAKELGRVDDLDAFVKAVLKREEEYSTAVGFGVAIPHGKTDAVVEPFLAYGRVTKVDWSALDGEPVDNVFMIGVPAKEGGNTHLQILAKLSRKLMKADFRDKLNHSETEEDLLQLLKDSEIL